jgi:hypothetical protein
VYYGSNGGFQIFFFAAIGWSESGISRARFSTLSGTLSSDCVLSCAGNLVARLILIEPSITIEMAVGCGYYQSYDCDSTKHLPRGSIGIAICRTSFNEALLNACSFWYFGKTGGKKQEKNWSRIAMTASHSDDSTEALTEL